jgi:hypothetical protein
MKCIRFLIVCIVLAFIATNGTGCATTSNTGKAVGRTSSNALVSTGGAVGRSAADVVKDAARTIKQTGQAIIAPFKPQRNTRYIGKRYYK